MQETSKPFACNIEGCEMTFTNEDHLNWHHKKHDMVLNLGIANKNAEVADQTPTPTRFIRNCEEVGLFQDLQNVNPFDETFKKAVESAKTGSLHVPEPSNDDTLHTPHIFPHVVETEDKYDARDQSTQSTDFCIATVHSTVQENDQDKECYDFSGNTNGGDKDKDRLNNNKISLKDKLKETIIKKGKLAQGISRGKITPVPLDKLKIDDIELTPQSSKTCEANNKNSKKRKVDKEVDDEREKVREMNRAAQLRCRKRKRIKWDKMEEDLKNLKKENAKLSHENIGMKHKICALREFILMERKDAQTKNSSLLTKVESILESNALPKKGPLTSTPIPILRHNPTIKRNFPIASSPSLVPLSFTQNTGLDQKPVLIQVLGSVSQLAVSVFPNK